jgi:phosphate-selective porin
MPADQVVELGEHEAAERFQANGRSSVRAPPHRGRERPTADLSSDRDIGGRGVAGGESGCCSRCQICRSRPTVVVRQALATRRSRRPLSTTLA